MSLRTLGTSSKKNRAKIPPTAPKEAAVIPLLGKMLEEGGKMFGDEFGRGVRWGS